MNGKKSRMNKFGLLLLLLGIGLAVSAQELLEVGKQVEVKLLAGNKFKGTYQGERDGFLVVEQESGSELLFRQEELHYIIVAGEKKPANRPKTSLSGMWYEMNNSHYHYFTPSAHPMPKRDWIWRNEWWYYQYIQCGITDQFSMSLMFDLGILLTAIPDAEISPLVGLSAKYTLPIEALPKKLNFAILGVALNLPSTTRLLEDEVSDEQFLDAAGPHLIATYGDRDRYVSGGIGYTYTNEGWGRQPSLTIGGTYRVTNWLAFNVEAMQVPQLDLFLATAGFRFIMRSIIVHGALPAALLNGQTNVPRVPFVGISLNMN